VVVVPAEGLGPTPGDRATSPSLASSVHVARIFAQELGGDGIRCNVLAAGRADEAGSTDPAVPLGNRPRFEQVGEAAYFLLSRNASYISGTTITVDGGLIDALRGVSIGAGKGA
jgi:3-oxoacyl-[acyl-carrier protein] reductase